MIEIRKYNVRLVCEESNEYSFDENIIKNPGNAVDVFLEVLELNNRTQEVLAMLTLNIKNNITGIMEVSTGGLSEAAVHPRDVFQRAILQNAAGIILAHNHPSQETKPSENDIIITKRLVEAGEIIGIDIYDHIIIGNGYTSLKQEGII